MERWKILERLKDGTEEMSMWKAADLSSLPIKMEQLDCSHDYRFSSEGTKGFAVRRILEDLNSSWSKKYLVHELLVK